MRESFRQKQEVTESLRCQEELRERLQEESRAREQLAVELSKAEGECLPRAAEGGDSSSLKRDLGASQVWKPAICFYFFFF